MRSLSTLVLLTFFLSASAELPVWWKELHGWDGVTEWSNYMNYTAAFFGPNALPVLEQSDARIAEKHNLELSTDVFWGFGDETQSLSTKFTYSFIPGKLAVSVWGVIAEHYKTSIEVRDQRASLIENPEETVLIGDFYISTQIGILKERKILPDINLEIVLKTASSGRPWGARFFDTPGYYFNLTSGKSLKFENSFLDEIRLSGNFGFLSYQTNTAYQNDAPLYGAKLSLVSNKFSWENGIGGYSGWLDQGDMPMVLRSKLIFKSKQMNYFIQYQHSLRDYPFRRLQTGASIDF